MHLLRRHGLTEDDGRLVSRLPQSELPARVHRRAARARLVRLHQIDVFTLPDRHSKQGMAASIGDVDVPTQRPGHARG